MTCAKQPVHCAIFDAEGRLLTVGSNHCTRPQDVCPRAPGEDYGKCMTVCQQEGHAEIQALRHASLHQLDMRGGEAVISGHYHACEPCARALRDAGIVRITIKVSK